MELRQIESLYWIAELGSFSAAANHLNTTQPAISGRILALEKELGLPLFDRSGRQVKLTRKGAEVLEYAERIMGLVATLRDAAGSGETRVRGTVRLGVVNTIAHTRLPRLIREIHRRYPDVDVDFQVDTSVSLRNHLLAHDLDLIISIHRVEEPGVTCEFFCRHSFDWVAKADIPIASDPTPLREMAQHRIITYSKRTQPYDLICHMFRARGIWPIRLSTSNSVAAIVELASAGVGICTIPRVVVQAQLAAGTLRTIPCEEQLPPLDFFASYVNGPRSEVAPLVADAVLGVAREEPLVDPISEAYGSASNLSI